MLLTGELLMSLVYQVGLGFTTELKITPSCLVLVAGLSRQKGNSSWWWRSLSYHQITRLLSSSFSAAFSVCPWEKGL